MLWQTFNSLFQCGTTAMTAPRLSPTPLRTILKDEVNANHRISNTKELASNLERAHQLYGAHSIARFES
jgi:hypothetical protein